jgi:hypothetical protein
MCVEGESKFQQHVQINVQCLIFPKVYVIGIKLLWLLVVITQGNMSTQIWEMSS